MNEVVKTGEMFEWILSQKPRIWDLINKNELSRDYLDSDCDILSVHSLLFGSDCDLFD